MELKKQITNVIYIAIDEINAENSPELIIQKSPDTRLFGGDSIIDSLGLVNLLVLIEEYINSEFDSSIIIADERAMSQRNSPFKSVESLAEYIIILINELKEG